MDNPDITLLKFAIEPSFQFYKNSAENIHILMGGRFISMSNGKSDVLPVLWRHQGFCQYQ